MSKICNKCGIEKEESEFTNPRNRCKQCRNEEKRIRYREDEDYRKKHKETNRAHYDPLKKKEYVEKNREIIAEQRKEYRAKNKELIAEKKRKYNKINSEKISKKKKELYANKKEKILEKMKTHYDQNRDKIKQRSKEYYYKNKENVLLRVRTYTDEHKDEIYKRHREYATINKEHLKEYKAKWARSELGRLYIHNRRVKRQELGYKPINNYFKGSHYHHLRYITETGHIDNDIGVFIPAELHKSVCHNGTTRINMDIINRLALEWYFDNTSEDRINQLAVVIYKNLTL